MRATLVIASIAAAAATTTAQPDRGPVEEDAHLPRGLTEAERVFLRDNPLSPVSNGNAPSGPLVCPPEYAPAQAIMMAWVGPNSWMDILADMASHITTTGDADVIIVASSSSVRNSAETRLAGAGADLSRVDFHLRSMNSIWMRDYGPRFVYEGGVRVIVDHTYNRPRGLDNGWPDFFADARGFGSYDLPLIHGGGNYHLSGLGDAYATELIVDENPGLTESDIVGHWRDFQNLETEIVTPFRSQIDSTQHIDMWMIPIADRAVIVSDWPLAPGSFEDVVCDAFAVDAAAAGYTVHRVPAVHTSNTHYTFTNSVICNDLVLIPSYTNSVASQYNADALSTWQAALPGHTVVQVPAQAIVTSAGVLHCIVMHVPEPLGGTTPSIFLQTQNERRTYDPGESAPIEWISDDDIDTYYVKLELSLDDGATWPITIDPFVVDSGGYNWSVPDVTTTQGRIRATVFDLDGESGFDVNDARFTIGGCDADFNGDGVADTQDVLAFLNAWAEGETDADFNGDGLINTQDVTAFLNAWASGC